MSEIEVGVVTHYFGKIGVAGIEITGGKLTVGDTIHILGHTTDLTETIGSMQVDNQSVENAEAGQQIGIKVSDHVREHDKVYKIEEG